MSLMSRHRIRRPKRRLFEPYADGRDSLLGGYFEDARLLFERDHADPAVSLEKGTFDLRGVRLLGLQAERLLEIFKGKLRGPHLLLLHLPILDQDAGLPLHKRAEGRSMNSESSEQPMEANERAACD